MLIAFTRWGLLLAASLSALFAPTAALAEASLPQTLVPSKSKIRFEVQGNPLAFSGGFRSYSGSLTRGKDFADSVISFAVDLSKVRLDPALGGLDIVSFEPLFQKINDPVGRFTSSKIQPQDKGRYLVVGNWERGGKREQVQFPVMLQSFTSIESRIKARVAQRIDRLEGGVPFPLGPQGAQGIVFGELLFRSK